VARTGRFRTRCYAGESPTGRPFAYVEVKKAACTSIKNALLPVFGLEESENVHLALKGTAHSISKGRLRQHFAGAYVFSFVRNPFDRLVSCHHSKIKPGHVSIRQEGLRPGMPFREFAELVCATPDEESDPHFRSQWTFFEEITMDFVGRLENLEGGFAEVAAVLGLPPDLPHANRSVARRDYRDYYDADLAEKVGDRYARDLEEFGYSF